MSLFYGVNKFISIPFETDLVRDFRMRYESHTLNVKAMMRTPRIWCSWFLKYDVTDMSIFWLSGEPITDTTTTMKQDAFIMLQWYMHRLDGDDIER